MITYALISSLANAITAALVGGLIYRRGHRSGLYMTYVLACASVVVWGVSYFIWQTARDASTALLFCRLLMTGAIFIPAFYFHHILILLGHKKPVLLRVSYAVAAFFLLSDLTPWFVSGVRPKLMFPFWPDAGPLMAPFLAYFVAVALYKLWLVQRALAVSKGNRRNQLLYVFIGTVIAYVGGLSNFALWYDIPILPLGNGAVTIYLVLTSYAIMRHRLLDINVIVRKTIVYSVVTGTLTVIYLGIVALFARVFQGLTGYQTIFSSAMAAGLITVGFQPLRKRVQAFVDTKFFRSYIDREEKLYELSREVITHTTPEAMSQALVRVLKDSLHPKAGVLYLKSREGVGYVPTAAWGDLPQERMGDDNPLAVYFADHPQPFVQEVTDDMGAPQDTRNVSHKERNAA